MGILYQSIPHSYCCPLFLYGGGDEVSSRTLMKEISALIKEVPEKLLTPLPCEVTVRKQPSMRKQALDQTLNLIAP